MSYYSYGGAKRKSAKKSAKKGRKSPAKKVAGKRKYAGKGKHATGSTVVLKNGAEARVLAGGRLRFTKAPANTPAKGSAAAKAKMARLRAMRPKGSPVSMDRARKLLKAAHLRRARGSMGRATRSLRADMSRGQRSPLRAGSQRSALYARRGGPLRYDIAGLDSGNPNIKGMYANPFGMKRRLSKAKRSGLSSKAAKAKRTSAAKARKSSRKATMTKKRLQNVRGSAKRRSKKAQKRTSPSLRKAGPKVRKGSKGLSRARAAKARKALAQAYGRQVAAGYGWY